MICQFFGRINTLLEAFWNIPLDELYLKFNAAVRSRTARFYIPDSECNVEADGYELCGGYYRKEITDIQRILNEDGTWEYKEVRIQAFRIQRIKSKQTGKTHAILNEIFIPYRQFSLRYILFHLSGYFEQDISQEAYCLEQGIDMGTFRGWLKWLKDHAAVLAGFGITNHYEDNRQRMREWVKKITGNVAEWTYQTLRNLNLTLFQQRIMPENTAYQKYVRPG